MDFALTDDQKTIQEAAHELASKVFAPKAAELDRTGEFPWAHFKALAEQGYLCMQLPADVGAAGADYLSYTLCVEEFSRACATTGVIFEVHNSLHSEPIHRFGNPEQHSRFLPPLISGEVLGAYALTEPDAGSDAAAIAATAQKVDGGYRLNGRKVFITNGGVAHRYIVYAVTDKSRGSRGISCFVVDREMPGVSFGPKLGKLGIRASATTDLVLEDVFVPDENLLGEEHEGYKIALATLHGGRIGIAAQAIGILQAALEEAGRYAKTRVTFGRPIADRQAIQWMIADMATNLEAARLLTYRAAWMHDRGVRATKEISMAKYFASKVAMAGTIDGVQIFGGYGYTDEYPAERLMRDAKITEIYEGTSEVQKMVIARAVLSEL